MEDVRIILAGLWVALMLTYLLGDVLRIFAGDFTSGEIDGQEASQWMWMVAAVVMLIPIAMIVLSLTLSYPAIRWVSLVASAFLIIFNIVGLPYPSAYDNFLIGVGFVFNGLIIWYAWRWV
jgi:ABC-type transport system involved in cytochrome c biogenesis permease component